MTSVHVRPFGTSVAMLTVDPDKVKEDDGKAQAKLKELTTKARSDGHKDEKQPADSVPPDRE